MKVKQLLLRLKDCDPDFDVILASDAEGNAIRNLDADGLEVHEHHGVLIIYPMHEELNLESIIG